MREIDINELKILQLDILSFVDKFCRDNDIQYWITCGTLLGAVRHGGYIPWDDDIDIGMMRDEYDKFVRLFPGKSERYELRCSELDKDYYLPFGKVMDSETVLYEPDENGYKFSVYIDIFVYDNAPDDDKKLTKMYDKRDFLRRLNHARTGYHRKTSNIAFEALVKISGVILKIFPKDYFCKRMLLNCKKYNQFQTQRIGNFTSETRMSCDKKDFDTFIELDFEGRKFKAPAGYHHFLSEFYGDYMKLPPVEKQISHHEFVAYYLN